MPVTLSPRLKAFADEHYEQGLPITLSDIRRRFGLTLVNRLAAKQILRQIIEAEPKRWRYRLPLEQMKPSRRGRPPTRFAVPIRPSTGGTA